MRLSKLVTDVLDLSRIDLGTLRFTIEMVDLTEMLEEIKIMMISRAEEKGLKLSLKMDNNLPKIKTDKEKLKEILLNLVDNAIKFTDKGSIHIRVHKEGKYIKFSISDTGIGIPKKEFKNIFVRFHQVEHPYIRKVVGTGLGLSICKEFIEALGGKIWFKSKFGKETTFFFTLPIVYKKISKLKIRNVYK
jgi:signal transduction histidine kinase